MKTIKKPIETVDSGHTSGRYQVIIEGSTSGLADYIGKVCSKAAPLIFACFAGAVGTGIASFHASPLKNHGIPPLLECQRPNP